ncbi:MAG: hypothetical protein ABF743_08235 [Schleiferilactobacillus perolens]|jgi:ABC-type antimicrobial peptide transport system ATPase subunit
MTMPITTTTIAATKDSLQEKLADYLQENYADKKFARVTDRVEQVIELLSANGVKAEIAEIMGYYPEESEMQLNAIHISTTNRLTLVLTVAYPVSTGDADETITLPLTVTAPVAETEA